MKILMIFILIANIGFAVYNKNVQAILGWTAALCYFMAYQQEKEKYERHQPKPLE